MYILHHRGLLVASIFRSLTIYPIKALLLILEDLILLNKLNISREVRYLRDELYLKIHKLNVRLTFIIDLL